VPFGGEVSFGHSLLIVSDESADDSALGSMVARSSAAAATCCPHFGQKLEPDAIGKPQSSHTMIALTIDLRGNEPASSTGGPPITPLL
jgi:hypothetical protein